VIDGLHTPMLNAGAEVIETDTIQGSRLKLDEWGLGDRTQEINTRAAQIARDAAGERCFLAGLDRPDGIPAGIR
jgi:5-methyltetrahydrofolate--homocysteine methyltransferase